MQNLFDSFLQCCVTQRLKNSRWHRIPNIINCIFLNLCQCNYVLTIYTVAFCKCNDLKIKKKVLFYYFKILMRGQRYQVFLDLEMPHSPVNERLGQYLVDMFYYLMKLIICTVNFHKMAVLLWLKCNIKLLLLIASLLMGV